MEKNDSSAEDLQPKTIEQFLRERDRIDSILHREFKKEITILFTDICGYTDYTEKRGDLSARAMLQKHNDIIFPIVEKYEGVVVKTIGDAVMATFSNPLPAVKAASDIQEGLLQHNVKVDPLDRIHVKIGVNTGDALMDDGDVFGDAVNVAARIQSKAKEDQILVSERVYRDVCGSDDLLCRLDEKVQVKGKAEPLQLYRVVWREEDSFSVIETKVRTGSAPTRQKDRHSPRVLRLEVTREKNRIKLSANDQSPGESSTIQQYEETSVSMDWVNERCHEMVDTLNKVNRRGVISSDVLNKLREIGQSFSDEFFTLNVKEKLKNSKADHLILNLDEKLVHVPWELLYDGQQFLCQKFSMGRLVQTRQTVVERRTRVLARPLKMLVLADPGGDLKGAYDEGTFIRDTMDRENGLINTSLRSGNVTPDFIKNKIRNFDLVHFAGHSDYDPEHPGESGWRLTGGIFKGEDISKMAGAGAMPALVFSNTCQSGGTDAWGLRESFQNEIFGLANVFLFTGVKHFVGTFWEIMDEPSSRFATEFYKFFMSGMTIGEAIRQARLELIREFGEENIVWASYLMYGDPTYNYMEQIQGVELRDEPEASPSVARDGAQTHPLRSGVESIDFLKPGAEKGPNRSWMAIAAGIIIIIGIFLWGYPGILMKGTSEYEKEALAYYNGGDFDKALETSKTIEDKNPDVRLAYLIQGEVCFRKGDLKGAELAFQKALDAQKGSDLEKSKAFIGLGRIASIRKQTDKALGYYQSASKASPQTEAGYLSQAVLLEGQGQYGKAMGLLEEARKYAPKDTVLAALANETRKKAELAGDREKQARIEKMVKELVETMGSTPASAPSDGWSSYPLTLWVMDFKTQGYSLQEGQEKLLVAGIEDQLLQHGRAQIVERTLLDKLLAELKLGTSKLVDKRTALSLGRILAAKLVLIGQVVFSGPQTQVSFRLIETETGRITASVSETFGAAVSASVLSEKLSKMLLEKLKMLYPLRGKIEAVKGLEATLNIGQRMGTRSGQKFAVVGQGVILEIISDQADTSLSKIVKGDSPLAEGMRVEALDDGAS